MSDYKKPNILLTLRFQLMLGAFLLIGFAIGSVGYFLIEVQKRLLMTDLQKSVVLQGRNIATSSTKILLRPDPELELAPLITKTQQENPDIQSIVVTDANGIILSHPELQNVGQKLALTLEGEPVTGSLVSAGEKLHASPRLVSFKTPVASLEQTVGYVCVHVSTAQMLAAQRHAMRITGICGAAAFLLTGLMSIVVSRRISRPLDIMVNGVRAIGDGDMATRIEIPNRNEFQTLASAFNDMTGRLQTAQDEIVTKRLMDREIEIAHRIQDTLIPSQPVVPSGVEVGLYYKSAEQVGGDYVDVIPISDQRLGLVMADVSGKGIPGLVVMAMLKVMVQEAFRSDDDLTAILCRVNETLRVNTGSNTFVTGLLGILEAPSMRLSMVNAGHTPVFHYNGATGKGEMVRLGGRPMGFFRDREFSAHIRAHELTLHPNDVMMWYTDGLNESQTTGQAQYGFERLLEHGTRHAEGGAKALVARMVEEETRFRGNGPQTDDLTLLSIGLTGGKLKQQTEREAALSEW